MKFLMALNYKRENAAALAVYNTETQLFDAFHRHVFEQEYPLCGFRGMAQKGNQVIAATSVELLFFRISQDPAEPLFVLEKTVQLPEWLIGAKTSGSLMDVYYSPSRERFYVSFYAMDALDELDMEGNLVSRIHIWDIFPETFSLHEYNRNSTSGYYYISKIFERNQKVHAVLSSIGSSGKGAVVDIENKKILLDGLELPQGTVFSPKCAFVNSSLKNEITVFSEDSNGRYGPAGGIPLHSHYPLWMESFQALDALFLDEKKSELYSFSSHWKPHSVFQSPAKIYKIETANRRICGELLVPEFAGLSTPYVRTMLEADEYTESLLLSKDKEKKFVNIDMTLPCNCRKNIYIKNNAVGIDVSKESEISSEKKDMEKSGSVAADNSETIIHACDVVLRYRRHKPKDKVRYFTALEGVSFAIKQNDVVGMIGRNGSGKSTLGKLIAGVLKPDSGTLTVKGRVSLLTLGTGFKQDLSGRDNIYINAAMLGYSKQQVKSVIDSIIEFTEIGDFIDEPIRTYSSGMKSRLGFAIAAYMEPEILVIDEVLSTGDNYFRSKAKKKIKDMMKNAKCVIIVSHQLDFIKKICSKCLWIEKGIPVMYGDAKKVVSEYSKYGADPKKWCRNNLGSESVKKLYQKIL